mgnify:CR=1 FL=1
MPSVEPVISAMIKVNRELETHFTHLSNPELDASDRETIGIHAAEGVRRGFNLMLDELEQEALAVQS